MTLEDELDEHDIAEELDRSYTESIDQESFSFWRSELEGLDRSYGATAVRDEQAAAVVKAALNLHLDVEAYRASTIDELDEEYSIDDRLEPFYDPRDHQLEHREQDLDPVYIRITPRS